MQDEEPKRLTLENKIKEDLKIYPIEKQLKILQLKKDWKMNVLISIY